MTHRRKPIKKASKSCPFHLISSSFLIGCDWPLVLCAHRKSSVMIDFRRFCDSRLNCYHVSLLFFRFVVCYDLYRLCTQKHQERVMCFVYLDTQSKHTEQQTGGIPSEIRCVFFSWRLNNNRKTTKVTETKSLTNIDLIEFLFGIKKA